jgi:hypothetical protein
VNRVVYVHKKTVSKSSVRLSAKADKLLQPMLRAELRMPTTTAIRHLQANSKGARSGTR